MFRVYLFSDFQQITSADLEYFSRILTPARKHKASVQKSWERKAATIISELLLRFGLLELTGSCDFELTYGKWGKPSFLYPQHLYFNISHCKGATVCVISDEEVGVDIEVMREVKSSIIHKVCTVEESERINRSDHPEEEFIKYWVMKESYAKLLGFGLSIDFRTIDTIRLRDKVILYRIGNKYISIARHIHY